MKRIFTKEHKKKLSEARRKQSPPTLGKRFSEESKKRMSLAQKKVKRKPLTEEHKRKIGLASKGRKLGPASPEARKKMSEAKLGKYTGEKSCHWKGDDKLKNQGHRNSTRYRRWRLAVYSKDNYTCQKCLSRGGKINAHHIENFFCNEELRFDEANGIVFCVKCHRKFHKEFGTKNNTLEQVLQFIKNV